VHGTRPTGAVLHGFSFIELVIVIVIIGIIAAIAVPRLASTTEHAQNQALQGTLRTVRAAIDLYQAEHGRYPGYNPANGLPSGQWFVNQLTLYSNAAGQTSKTFGAPFIYGPYLRLPFPTNPFNELANVKVIASKPGSLTLGSSGWVAILSTGEFDINGAGCEIDDVAVQSSGLKT
jgi:prepilin-type N-terminal cleavage/methylation domain-containing protein